MSRQIKNIELTNKEKQELKRRIRLTKDRKTADKLRVIWFKSKGLKHEKIAELLNISINTVTDYVTQYLQGGLNALCHNNYKGSKPSLTLEQRNELKIELICNIYTSTEQVVIWVKNKYDVHYTTSGMRKLLKRLGFTYKKNRLMPSKADPNAQKQFTDWFRKIRDTLGPDDRIYFCDAAHVIHNTEAGFGWSEIGNSHCIPSNSGRQRYNILGAYCTQTHENVFILTEKNINQDTMIELLGKLHKKHQKGQIYLILDNASYNRANRVKNHAELCGITLKYQPAYSPNLNLIERLWKFMRGKLFKDKYVNTFEKFKKKIDLFFTNLRPYRKELETLLVEVFQTLPSNWQFPVLIPFSRN